MSTAISSIRTRFSPILLRWLLERKGWTGGVTRAFNTTKMLDRIAASIISKLYEHGIGFKYVCDLMLDHDILIGGEESGGIGIKRHLPERDGLLNSLLLANVMAEEKKTLGQLVARPAAGIWRASLRPHRSAHSRRDQECGHRARANHAARRERIRRHAGPARGDAGRHQVLPRQSRGEDEAECGRDLAAAARLRDGAADAHLLRVVSKESVNKLLESARAFALASK